MEKKFTKGDWVIKEDAAGNDQTGIVSFDEQVMVALCTQRPEMYHNAKLMAAAPELLHELYMLVDYVKRECTVVHKLSEPEINIIVGSAEKAIQKATS